MTTFTTHENSVLPRREIFPNDNFLRKPAPFIGLDLEDTVHQTDQSAISISRHFLTGFDRIWPDLTGFDWIWPDLTGSDRIWLDLTGFDQGSCSRMFHKDTVQRRNNQRSAFSHHFLTFDLMIFFFFLLKSRLQSHFMVNCGVFWWWD